MQILRMMICLFMINGTFVLKPIYAQEHWGKEDSIKLSKMLNGEMPIYINKKIKIEFEKSLLEHPQIEDNDEWKKYLNFKQSLTYHWLSPITAVILLIFSNIPICQYHLRREFISMFMGSKN